MLEGFRLLSEDAGESHIFTRANTETIRAACSDIVKLAVELSCMMKLSFFSATLTTTWIEPQSTFDESLMEHQGGPGEVQCTIALGLCELDSRRNSEVIVRPKVLLTNV